MSPYVSDLETQTTQSQHDPPPRPGQAVWDLEHYTRIGRVRALPFTEADLLDLTEESLAELY